MAGGAHLGRRRRGGDGRYTVDHLRESFRSDPGSIHHIFTHGSGDGFEINGEYLHSEELAEMPYKPGLPLVVSPSCLGGGFDYNLIDVPHDMDGYSIGGAIIPGMQAEVDIVTHRRRMIDYILRPVLQAKYE